MPEIMPLSDVQISQIRKMKHDELLRAAQTPDMGVVVEAALRLHRATIWLNLVLIALTVVLVGLTYELVHYAG